MLRNPGSLTSGEMDAVRFVGPSTPETNRLLPDYYNIFDRNVFEDQGGFWMTRMGDVGENIGARLQSEQAEADTRMARAVAESRLAEAIAQRQEMLAKVTSRTAERVLAEATVPVELANAFRRGQFEPDSPPESGYPRIRRPA